MQYDWFAYLPAAKKEARKQLVATSTLQWEVLTEVLERKLEATTPDYDTHNWAYRQAHQNGRNQAIREIMKLLTLRNS